MTDRSWPNPGGSHLGARPGPAAPRSGLAAPDHWSARLWRRIRHRLWLKLIGVSGFTWLFFIAYFHLLRHPAYPVQVMPLTALDHALPFQPWWLGPYLSLWFYVGIAPGLMRRLPELLAYGAWAAVLCLAGLGFFYFLPTSVPVSIQDGTALPAFAMLHGVDAPGNACPSMHVAVAMFSALWIDRVLRVVRVPAALRWLNAAWFLAIAYSTLAIKQHVALDALAGAVLGLAVAWPSMRWHPRLQADVDRGERPDRR